jgi:hypothetical protein
MYEDAWIMDYGGNTEFGAHLMSWGKEFTSFGVMTAVQSSNRPPCCPLDFVSGVLKNPLPPQFLRYSSKPSKVRRISSHAGQGCGGAVLSHS